MNMLHSRFRVLAGVTVLLVILVAVPAAPFTAVEAQDGDGHCIQLASDAISGTQKACGDLGPGEACFGHPGVAAEGAAMTVDGDKANLVDVLALRTTAPDLASGEWGIAVLTLSAGLPDDLVVPAILFGEAEMMSVSAEGADRSTLSVSNQGSAEVNLRNGAGVMYEVVGSLQPGEAAIADGRNEQADWVRVQYSGGTAWVFTPLVRWEGDINSLEVLLPTDVTPAFQSGEPYQSFTLTTGMDHLSCLEAPSGLLLQYTGEPVAGLQINQVGLEFSNATLLVQAARDDAIEISVFDGMVAVTARGILQDAQFGDVISVGMGGEDGLTPTGTPVIAGTYSFPETAYVPLELLPGTMACVVGLPTPDADVRLRVGPGDQRGELGTLRANMSYAVLGWANDPEGAAWWELDTGAQSSWARQAEVRAIGACDAVAQVEPPPVVVAPPGSQPPAGDTGAASGSDLAPTANSVWQMRPGSDNLSGECSGAPAINFCDHLAAIAPAEGGISWKGMEASPYILGRTRPNVYYYAGPNVLGTGTLTMTLTFSSPTELNMIMTLVLSSEPDCQHTYYYSGTRNW